MYHLAPPLDPQRYTELCARANRFNAWVDTKRNKRSGWASCAPGEVPAELRDVNPTTEERGLIELQDFHARQPDALFCYISDVPWKCTNFAGQRLGLVTLGARYYVPGFGGDTYRRPVRLAAINGCVYSGTFFESSGDYARMKKTKRACSPEAMELMRRANFGAGAI